jgi:hypothetical protein
MATMIMEQGREAVPVSAGRLWAGRIISLLMIVFMLFDSIIKLINIESVQQSMRQIEIPGNLARPIGIIELVCVVLYIIPRTSVYGIILLTGYLGGATAIKLRMEDPWCLFSVGVGLLLWVGLILRDEKVSKFLK